MREIRALTGIRGVAALYVALYHFFLAEPIIVPAPIIISMFGHGYIAVDLFFVLSGFVMALSYKRMFDERLTFRLVMVFLGRRLARIYPLYFCVALAAVATVLAHHSQRLSPADLPLAIPANLALVQSWFNLKSLEAPMWSISTEWAAYLVFPLLLRASFGSRLAAFGTLSACILTLIGLTFLPAWSDPLSVRSGWPLDHLFRVPGALLARCFAEFVLGLLAFRLSKSSLGERLASSSPLGIVLCAIIVALLPWHASDLLLIACFTLLIVAISADRGWIARLLGSRIVYTLGVWSYAIYLIHPMVRKLIVPIAVRLAQHVMPTAYAVPAGVIASLPFLAVLSALAYRYIEQPGRTAIKALISREWLGGKRFARSRPLPEQRT